MDHGDLGNAMYTGESEAIGAGNMVLLVFFLASGIWLQRASLIFLCCSRHEALKGPPSLGSIGQLLALACGEREATVMAPPSAPNSAVVPCFLVLLQRYSTL